MRVRLFRPKANRQIRIPRLIPHLHSGPHTDRTDLTVLLCGWEISQRLYAGLLQCLTQIAQISRFPLWVENLTDALRRLAPLPHTDRTDLTVLLCGWKISQRLHAGLLQCLTQIQRDSTKIKFVLIHGFSHQPRISTIFLWVY